MQASANADRHFKVAGYTFRGSNCHLLPFNSLSTVAKIPDFANSVDLDEVAQYEPPDLDLHCLPACPLVFEFSICYSMYLTFFENLQTKILSSAFWSLKS